MGLDITELVMRIEEEFGVGLDSHPLESTQTVGDLFEIICDQLNLPPDPDTLQPLNRPPAPHAVATVDGWNHDTVDGWSRDAVWSKLVQICLDQFQVAPHEVTYAARIVDDLGAD